MSNKSESVRVCVRIRPLSTKEKQDGHQYAVFAKKDRGEISLQDPSGDANDPPKTFTFDATFPPETEQMDVYRACASDIVDCVMDGFNGTIFAYGQTGAGKSHTMEGCTSPPELKGIIPNSFTQIFNKVQAAENKKFLVRASYLEIYNEEIRDLLSKDSKNSLELKENVDSGVYVKDLSTFMVKDVAEIDYIMQSGKKNRSVGATQMNQQSSRSHSMFIIVVECAGTGIDGNEHICVGKLNLVDLAGSERQSKTGATGDRLKEATKINLSLSALGNVISALTDSKSSHVPYRDSKLTRLLQDSLGGNAKTVMIANVGPANYNYDETLSTIRYASRAKNIKNKPKINEDPKDAMLREHQDEIIRLKAMLEAQAKGMTTQIIDGKEVQVAAPEKEIREKIVERVTVKREGLSEEELKELEEKARQEKKTLQERAAAEMKALAAEQHRTRQEKSKLEEELRQKSFEKSAMAKEKDNLLQKLTKLEEKLIQGGQIMSKAAEQELELQEAQKKLTEQERQERRLAQELAAREDSNLLLEEKHQSIQEEVEVKTKKLKKLWAKHKSAMSEIHDMNEEFGREKEDMLETIRELNRQIKLYARIQELFIPFDEGAKLEKRIVWNEEENEWRIQKILDENSTFGNLHKGLRRPVSIAGLRRPETLYAREHKSNEHSTQTRFKYDNIISLDLEMPDRTTQDFEGPSMTQQVQQALDVALKGEDEEIVFEGGLENVSRPQQEEHDDSIAGSSKTNGDKSSIKNKSKRSGSER